MGVAGHSIGNEHIELGSHTHQASCVAASEERMGQHLAHQRPTSWILGQHLRYKVASQQVLDQVNLIILEFI